MRRAVAVCVVVPLVTLALSVSPSAAVIDPGITPSSVLSGASNVLKLVQLANTCITNLNQGASCLESSDAVALKEINSTLDSLSSKISDVQYGVAKALQKADTSQMSSDWKAADAYLSPAQAALGIGAALAACLSAEGTAGATCPNVGTDGNKLYPAATAATESVIKQYRSDLKKEGLAGATAIEASIQNDWVGYCGGARYAACNGQWSGLISRNAANLAETAMNAQNASGTLTVVPPELVNDINDSTRLYVTAETQLVLGWDLLYSFNDKSHEVETLDSYVRTAPTFSFDDQLNKWTIPKLKDDQFYVISPDDKQVALVEITKSSYSVPTGSIPSYDDLSTLADWFHGHHTTPDDLSKAQAIPRAPGTTTAAAWWFTMKCYHYKIQYGNALLSKLDADVWTPIRPPQFPWSAAKEETCQVPGYLWQKKVSETGIGNYDSGKSVYVDDTSYPIDFEKIFKDAFGPRYIYPSFMVLSVTFGNMGPGAFLQTLGASGTKDADGTVFADSGDITTWNVMGKTASGGQAYDQSMLETIRLGQF